MSSIYLTKFWQDAREIGTLRKLKNRYRLIDSILMQTKTQENKHHMDLKDIRALIDDDMNAVDTLIRQSLHSEVALIGELGNYLINSGGKRVRPILVLLSARVKVRHVLKFRLKC